MCMCVGCCFQTIFEEVIDHAADGTMTASAYFSSQEKNLQVATNMIRLLGIIAAVAGLWFIFTPIIVILKWVPLIGLFLGGVAQLASFLFALLAGVSVSLFVISLAWLFYRPFLSLSMLAISGLGGYLIFVWDG